MRNLVVEMRTALLMTALLCVVLCGIYPALVFAVAQGLFPEQANGSLVYRQGTIVGSALLGQAFTEAKYFHPRPSAAGAGYDATASGGSNLGPLSKKLIDTVRLRVEQYRAENGLNAAARVPADAVTASASGLDPHISVKNALLQAARVAKARNMSEAAMCEKIDECTEGRSLGLFGEPGVNVLRLNLSLDAGKTR